jgi:hypothetical protein
MGAVYGHRCTYGDSACVERRRDLWRRYWRTCGFLHNAAHLKKVQIWPRGLVEGLYAENSWRKLILGAWVYGTHPGLFG